MKTITTIALAFVMIAGTAYGKQLPQANSPISIFNSKKLAEVFGTFHTHRQGDFASLNWNVESADVSSFQIQRMYPGLEFETIATVTPDESRWNRYIDETVEPGIIYYRIIAVMNDGSTEYSTTESVKIVKHK